MLNPLLLFLIPINIEHSIKLRDLLYINLMYLNKFLVDKTSSCARVQEGLDKVSLVGIYYIYFNLETKRYSFYIQKTNSRVQRKLLFLFWTFDRQGMLQFQDFRVGQKKEPYIRFTQENLVESSVQTSLFYIPNQVVYANSFSSLP